MSAETPHSIPATQKAWMVVTQGNPREALSLESGVPVPKPGRGEVLVRVRAAALNPVGWKIMGVLPNALSRRPHPAEHDLAGVIVDANGSSFFNGEDVIGFIPVPLQFSSRQGALAQYVTLPTDNVTLKPAMLSWEEAAALPLAALTAVQAMRLGGYDPARSRSRSSTSTPTPTLTSARTRTRTPAATPAHQEAIFINGGTTSVGIYAIQLAKSLSLHVTTSTSARNASWVRDTLGADVVLDYTAHTPLVEQLCARAGTESGSTRRFGMVLDAVGQSDTALYDRSGTYVKKGGVYVTTGPWPDRGGWMGLMGRWTRVLLRPSFLGGVSTTCKIVGVENKKEDMHTLCTLIERGKLRPHVDSTYGFESALDAYDRIMTGRARGKVVVKVD